MNKAIIVASGKGLRMHNNVPKQWIKIDNKPIVFHTLKAFDDCQDIDEIYLVISPSDRHYFEDSITCNKINKLKGIVYGGNTRTDSVFNGLKSISASNNDIVLIHDGVRPCINSEFISKCINEAKTHSSCVPCLKCNETIYISHNGETADSLLNRNEVFAVQTPQCFKFSYIYECFKKFYNSNDGFIPTDEGSMYMKYFSKQVHLTDGLKENIKITTPSDLLFFETYLKSKSLSCFKDKNGVN